MIFPHIFRIFEDMRIYQSATIKDERLTGFQSPCSEFAQKPLSLDEKIGVGNPSLLFLQIEASFPAHGIYKGDWVVIDLSKRPGEKSLVVAVVGDEVRVFKGAMKEELEDVRVGVVVVVVRDYR